jgi:hypothetical protein
LTVPDAADLWAWGPRWSGGPEAGHEETRPGYALEFALRKAGYLTESEGTAFAARPFNLSSYRLLVLPENALLDDGLAGQIRDYVRNGGTLLALGHAALLDETGQPRSNFALADVFGADFAGSLPGYKQFAANDEIASTLPLNVPALDVKPTTGKALGKWASAGDAPAVIENQFGKGRVIYVSAAEASLAQAHAMLTELAGRLIGPPPITVQSMREYALAANRKGNDLLVYLLNRSTGSRANTDTEAAKGTAFAGPENITVEVDMSVVGEIVGAELVSPRAPVRLSRRGRFLEISFPASTAVTTLKLRR